MKRAAPLVVFAAALAGCGGHAQVRLTATPRDALIDAPLIVHATGLHGPATLTVTVRDAHGEPWVARRPFANGNAETLLPLTLPQKRHVNPATAEFFPARPQVIHVSVSKGGNVLAGATVIRRLTDPQVKVRSETPARNGFVGRFCVGPRTRGPGILLLGGSEGGLLSFDCPILASHGYPTLALAYFGLPGLPRNLVNIPLEYFSRALRWLAHQPDVDPRKVIVMGISRGGEAALLVAATYPKLAHGAIGLVPSAVVYPGLVRGLGYSDASAWTLHGKPLPYFHRDSPNTNAAAIRVERISGPVFVVGAGDDGLWPSETYVDDIAERLHEHGRHDVIALTYPQAGHAAGAIIPSIHTATIVRSSSGTLDLGGTRAANARARADSWPKLLRFLSKL